jgi:hypothetical protein
MWGQSHPDDWLFFGTFREVMHFVHMQIRQNVDVAQSVCSSEVPGKGKCEEPRTVVRYLSSTWANEGGATVQAPFKRR